MAAAIVGVERAACLIGRCAIYEQLYLTGDVPKNAKEATENLRKGLLALYTVILQALCRLIRVFQSRIPYCLFFGLLFFFLSGCCYLECVMMRSITIIAHVRSGKANSVY